MRMWFIDLLIKFAKTNTFIGLMTVLAALGVIIVYWLQKRSEKINYARIILMEIRNAERAIDQTKTNLKSNIYKYLPVLPENSWIKYNHLFVNDLNSDQLDIVNNFYNQCAKCESLLKGLEASSLSQITHKANYIQEKLVDIAFQVAPENDKENEDLKKVEEKYKFKRKYFLEFCSTEPYIFPSEHYIKSIQIEFPAVKYVSNTPCHEKLKRIAKFK